MIAAERWSEVDAAYYPANILREKPHRFASLVYVWCLERVAHDKIEEWERDLEELLPWQDSTSEAAVNAESESFMAMMNRQG